MTIYLDKENHVYASAADGRTAVETTVLDGMPVRAIECYKYVNKNGVEFIQAFVSASEITNQYAIGELESQNTELLGTIAEMVEEVYQSDLEVME